MKNPLETLMQGNGVQAGSLPITSRYHGVGTAKIETVDNKKTVYLRRRLVPPPERFDLLQEHTVTDGDRLDNLAHQYLGDPEQFWRLCDANGAVRPNELTKTVGSKLKITLPEGIPGLEND